MSLHQRLAELERRTVHLPQRGVGDPPFTDLADDERAALLEFANVVQKVLAECHPRSEQIRTGKLLIRLLRTDDEERRKILNIRDEDLARLPQG